MDGGGGAENARTLLFVALGKALGSQLAGLDLYYRYQFRPELLTYFLEVACAGKHGFQSQTREEANLRYGSHVGKITPT